MCCGVTSLGLDHISLLGGTLESIAWQKAGIFKVLAFEGLLSCLLLLIPGNLDSLIKHNLRKQMLFKNPMQYFSQRRNLSGSAHWVHCGGFASSPFFIFHLVLLCCDPFEVFFFNKLLKI